MLLRGILEQNGFEVVGEAANGEAAIALYDKVHPDLVTMDLILPGISGAEATAKLLEKDSKVKVVAISSMGGTPQKLTEILKAGARNVISKPFDGAKVVAVLNDVLKG